MDIPAADILDTFSGAIEFIFEPRDAVGVRGQVGGLDQVWEVMWPHIWISAVALAVALVIALPLGLLFGHRGRGELVAVALGNAGRAIPELGLIAIMVAFIGTGVPIVLLALMVLGIPPILTNAFVGVRQVDRDAVEAARGMGMTEFEIVRSVELPLAIPTIMSGVRTAAIAIIATATIAPIASVETLGDFIFNNANYGDDGLLAGAILVALLALAAELLLARLQRVMTPRGLQVRREPAGATA